MIEQRTEAWHKQREGRITGSVVGAILGLSPYKKSADVLRDMVRTYYGQRPEFKGNIAMDYGTRFEQQAIEEFTTETGLTVEPAEFVIWKDGEWLGASPDGYTSDGGLIEVKCPYKLRSDPAPEFDSIDNQLHYYAQIQIQLLVTGRTHCWFWQWSPVDYSNEYVAFDPDWIDEFLPELQAFYDLYLSERAEGSAWRYLDGGEMAHNYKRAKQAFDDAKAMLDNAKAELINHAEVNGAGKIGDINVTQVKKKGAISYQKACADLLEGVDLEEYRGKDSTYWRVG